MSTPGAASFYGSPGDDPAIMSCAACWWACVSSVAPPTGALFLIRRSDTGEWRGWRRPWNGAKRCAGCATRELHEEADVDGAERPRAAPGTYSHIDRDPRFHAVTIVVEASASLPEPSVAPQRTGSSKSWRRSPI